MPSRTRPQESHTPQVDLKFSIPAGKDNLMRSGSNSWQSSSRTWLARPRLSSYRSVQKSPEHMSSKNRFACSSGTQGACKVGGWRGRRVIVAGRGVAYGVALKQLDPWGNDLVA